MKLKLIALFFVIAPFTGALAQHNVIEYTYYDDSKIVVLLKELIFKDTLSNTVLKKIEVNDLNPFEDLPYPVHEKATKSNGYKVYDLTGKRFEEVAPAKVLDHYDRQMLSKYSPTIGQYSIDNKRKPDKTILKFNFSISNDTARLVEYSDIYVFSNDGKELFALKNNDFNILNADINNEGNYLFCTYGMWIKRNPLAKGGIKIYDLMNHHPLLEIPGEEISSRFINDSMVFMFYNGPFRDKLPDRWLKVLDLKNMKMYTRLFRFEEVLKIKSVKEYGVVYKDSTVDFYIPTFDVADLDWKSYISNENYIDYKYFSDTLLNSQVESVIFRNPLGQVNSIININSSNPFNAHEYPLIQTSGNTIFYDLKGIFPKKILPSGVLKDYTPLIGPGAAFEQGRASASCSGDDRHAVIIYSFSMGIKYENLVNFSRLYVYNANGENVFKFEDNDGFIWDVKLDQNSRFLCYRYAIGNTDTVLKAGYRIWDLGKPGQNLDITTANAAFQFVAPGMICLYNDGKMPGDIPSTRINILDLNNKKSYVKTYPNDKLREISLYTTEGIVFKDKKTDYYKEDFEGGELSWEKYSERKR